MKNKEYESNVIEYFTKTFLKHACQLCGSEQKFVETIIDDEFFWNEDDKMYQPNKYTINKPNAKALEANSVLNNIK